jgi:catalase
VVFKQANERFLSLSIKEKEAFIRNVIESLMFVNENTQKKVVDCFKTVNEELGLSIEKQL